jgi:hypothetical protein
MATDRDSVGCFGLGFILDLKSLSQRRRAQVGLLTVVLLNLGVYIWSIVMQVRFSANPPGGIDWNSSLYPSAFLPYFFVQTTGPLSQSYMYWLLCSFATDAQCEWHSRTTINKVVGANDRYSEREERRRLQVSYFLRHRQPLLTPPMYRSRRPSHSVRHEHQDRFE